VEKVTLLQHSLAVAADQDKENRQFKALPLPTEAPFKPRPSTRPLTELNEFNLQSDSRAAQRAAFEERMRAKEAAEAEARRQAQLAREREEEREVRRLRKRLVHKARPIPLSVYQPMQALPSSKALTDPASPCLLTKRLRRGANHHHNSFRA
jgi:targeting protein for Xklp2